MKYVAIVTETDTDYTYKLCEAESYDLLITDLKNRPNYDIRFNKKDETKFYGWIEDDYREPYCDEIPFVGHIKEVV